MFTDNGDDDVDDDDDDGDGYDDAADDDDDDEAGFDAAAADDDDDADDDVNDDGDDDDDDDGDDDKDDDDNEDGDDGDDDDDDDGDVCFDDGDDDNNDDDDDDDGDVAGTVADDDVEDDDVEDDEVQEDDVEDDYAEQDENEDDDVEEDEDEDGRAEDDVAADKVEDDDFEEGECDNVDNDDVQEEEDDDVWITLREPAQSKCTWTSDKNHLLRKVTGKMTRPTVSSSIKHRPALTLAVRTPQSGHNVWGKTLNFHVFGKVLAVATPHFLPTLLSLTSSKELSYSTLLSCAHLWTKASPSLWLSFSSAWGSSRAGCTPSGWLFRTINKKRNATIKKAIKSTGVYIYFWGLLQFRKLKILQTVLAWTTVLHWPSASGQWGSPAGLGASHARRSIGDCPTATSPAIGRDNT